MTITPVGDADAALEDSHSGGHQQGDAGRQAAVEQACQAEQDRAGIEHQSGRKLPAGQHDRYADDPQQQPGQCFDAARRSATPFGQRIVEHAQRQQQGCVIYQSQP